MKGKQLVSLLGIVAVVGGLGYYMQSSNRNSWSEKGSGVAGAKVLDLAINDIARVTVKSATGELNLVKKDDIWTVGERANYPANFEQISGLLIKLDKLKTVQEVKVGPSQFARMELIEPGKGEGAGTLLEFKDKDGKNLGSLLLGKKHMQKGNEQMAQFGMSGDMPAGRYIVKPGSTNVSLVSDSFEDVTLKPESWLKRDFFKLENVTGITLAGTTDAQKWKITRESATAEWKLDGAKPEESLDAAKVNPISSALAFPSFADVMAPDAKPEETGLEKPAVITFDTSDKFTYTLKIGKVTGDNYPVTITVAANLPKERTPGKDEKPEDKTKLNDEFKATQKRLEDKLANEKKSEGRPYLIAKATIDQLLKDRASLLAEKKPETPPATPGAPAAPGAGVPPGIALPPGATPQPAKPSAPISVTTPPVSVPPQPAQPPVTATTPPVAAPPLPTPPNPAAPDAKPAAPEPKPAAPEPKPATPEAKPATPEAKPAAPEAKPAVPEAKPAASEAKPAAPENAPAAPQK
ncbi:MAG: hypothetical protein RL088_2312 [Verrucomicrobiota bacterium]